MAARILSALALATACGGDAAAPPVKSVPASAATADATAGAQLDAAAGAEMDAAPGSGNPVPPGYGYGHGGRPKDPNTLPVMTVGQASVDNEAALDKAIVRRYIKRNAMNLSYCYEKQMANKPGLAGIVTAHFTIGLDGLVAESAAVGVDTDVSRCVGEVIRGIEFPKPHGAAVNVTYPIEFAPPKSPPAGAVAAQPDKGVLGIIEEKNLEVDGSPPVDGQLSASMIDQPIRHEAKRFRACYETARKTKPTLEGKVVATIKIEADGKVSKHEAHGLDDAVDACVDRVIASIRFPASTSGAFVHYPFHFTPE